MTKHDYKEIESKVKSAAIMKGWAVFNPDYRETISNALKVANKLMQEPSDEMKNQLPNQPGGSLICEADIQSHARPDVEGG